MLTNTREEQIYASVLADGKFHVTVYKDTPNAKLREYETSDGKKGEKWELTYDTLTGTISKINFFDGDFGKSLQITLTDGENEPVVMSLSTASSFGEDVLKKLPNIDQNKPVKFVPYSFEDAGKVHKGITITQDGVKLGNYFQRKEVIDGKNVWTNLYGYPEAPKPKKNKKTGEDVPLSSDEWKIYYTQVRLFLIDYVTEHCGIADVNESVVEPVKQDDF